MWHVRLLVKVGIFFVYAIATTRYTIDGALKSVVVQTQGWGWMLGGGLEVWMAPAVGLYADAGFVKLKGASIGGGEARLDDRMRYVTFGLRVHIGR
jgi:hypothetical protein